MELKNKKALILVHYLIKLYDIFILMLIIAINHYFIFICILIDIPLACLLSISSILIYQLVQYKKL